ncbi:MAG TPA: hypothetical protein VGG20_28005 [Thermoanaerobaculia bacterium]
MLYAGLYEISKLLLAEDDAERKVLPRRLVERCGAETGFVVVREDGSYQQKHEVGKKRGRAGTSGLESPPLRLEAKLSKLAQPPAGLGRPASSLNRLSRA